MKKGRLSTVQILVLVLVLGMAGVLVWTLFAPDDAERVTKRQERKKRRQVFVEERKRMPSPRPSRVAPKPSEVPSVAAEEVNRYAEPDVWFGAVAMHGLDAFDPWQDHDVAVDVLCAAPEQTGDLHAFAESFVWEREARGVWAVSQRVSGARRVEMIRLLAQNAGLEQCGLVDELQRRLDAGEQDPVVVPPYGSVDVLRAQERDVLEKLRRGEPIFDP